MGDCSLSKIQPNQPHFFQPLIPGFHHNFSIPKAFVKYLGENAQEDEENNAELIDRTGRSWHVKVVGDDMKQFKDGWLSFCKDHDLQVGDFLVFRHEGNLVFQVLIFSPTACERKLPVLNPRPQMKVSSTSSNPSIANNEKGYQEKKRRDTRGDSLQEKVALSFKPSHYPYCRTVIKPYCFKWGGMPIPSDFAGKNNLRKRWCDMTLIDDKGRTWLMPLRHQKHLAQKLGGTPYIGGWGPFHEANGLKSGDPMILELIDSGEKPVMKFYRK